MNLDNISLQNIHFDIILITMLGLASPLLFLDNHTKALMHLLHPIVIYFFRDKSYIQGIC